MARPAPKAQAGFSQSKRLQPAFFVPLHETGLVQRRMCLSTRPQPDLPSNYQNEMVFVHQVRAKPIDMLQKYEKACNPKASDFNYIKPT